MNAPTLLLVVQDACLAEMLTHELSRAGYCVVADSALPCAIDCAVVDLDTALPPEGIPYVGITRIPDTAEGNASVLLRPFLVTALLTALEQTRQTTSVDAATATAPLALAMPAFPSCPLNMPCSKRFGRIAAGLSAGRSSLPSSPRATVPPPTCWK